MNRDDLDYRVSARAYLQRARDRLLDETQSSLFYAALELRCCIEARQTEYLEHLRPYVGKRMRPHRLGESRQKIAAITGGKLIAKVTFAIPGMQPFEVFHTPVPASLVQYCERHLDNLRHAQSSFREPSDPWWQEIRSSLAANYRQAWIACQGELMVPPLWKAATGEAHPMIFDVTKENKKYLEYLKASIGSQLVFDIEYLEDAPSDWICDLQRLSEFSR